MISCVEISSKKEYEFAKARGFEPLVDSRFLIDINVRVRVQKETFSSDEQFYKFHFENSPYEVCEECGFPIREYAAIHCSHILTRGAHPEMRYDFRNANKLCPKHHTQWEDYTRREKMLIYKKNLKTIELLTEEYKTLRL